jgi:3-polyprenyl-4-hydroxybenzoate decarboxylase
MSEAMQLAGRHIVLGMSGGIACYKGAELTRALVKAGATVQVVMTQAAEAFITVVTMQALSGRPVFTDQWDAREPNNMAHIGLTRDADAIIVAPASADFIAKLANGLADDLLSLACLARPIARAPLLVAPAMNREMWAHPATQRNVARVRADGALVVGPASGDQACGEVGDGRMLEAAELCDEVIAALQPKALVGRRVLVTAGPTFEANRSGARHHQSLERQDGVRDRACRAGSRGRRHAGVRSGATRHAATRAAHQRRQCAADARRGVAAGAGAARVHRHRGGGRLAACELRAAQDQEGRHARGAGARTGREPRHPGRGGSPARSGPTAWASPPKPTTWRSMRVRSSSARTCR